MLIHLLKDTNIETALVFTRTKHGADKIAKDLVRNGIRAEAIHGNKSQNARQDALQNFKMRKTKVCFVNQAADNEKCHRGREVIFLFLSFKMECVSINLF